MVDVDAMTLCLICRYWRATHGLVCEACAQDLPVDHADGLRTAPITAVSSVPDPRGAHPLRPGDRATP
jgi:hypothetical protein